MSCNRPAAPVDGPCRCRTRCSHHGVNQRLSARHQERRSATFPADQRSRCELNAPGIDADRLKRASGSQPWQQMALWAGRRPSAGAERPSNQRCLAASSTAYSPRADFHTSAGVRWRIDSSAFWACCGLRAAIKTVRGVGRSRRSARPVVSSGTCATRWRSASGRRCPGAACQRGTRCSAQILLPSGSRR